MAPFPSVNMQPGLPRPQGGGAEAGSASEASGVPSNAMDRRSAVRPELLDSTLREGEQTPGVRYRLEDKVAIARELDAFGVDYLEVGHPAVSNDVFAACKAITREGLRTQTMAHARALREDVDRARQCDVSWVGIFYSVREEALQQRFRRDLAQVITQVQDVVGYAKEHGLKVRYTPEDTVRSPWANV